MKTIKSFLSNALLPSVGFLLLCFVVTCSKDETQDEPIKSGVKPTLSRMEDPAYVEQLKGHQQVEQLAARRLSLLREELRKESAKPEGERNRKKISLLEKNLEEAEQQFSKAQQQARATVANRIRQDLNQKKGN